MEKIKARPISSQTFDSFGAVVQMTDQGPTAADESFKFWSDIASYRIDGDTEIGLCTVYSEDRDIVNWMEQHMRTPEILIPVGGPLILPVMSEEEGVRAYRVEPGEAVVIGPGVWHSACKPVNASEVTYFVIFRRGTPAEDVIKKEIDAVELAL